MHAALSAFIVKRLSKQIMSYLVQLENFDGPLDLLLYLIRKNEVELFNIPIAEITKQYLEYLEVITSLDLESASDYILMAATLIRIKAKMLLPKPPIELDEEDEEDPREELMRRLLEYQRYKEVAFKMSESEEYQRLCFKRNYAHGYPFEDEATVHWQPSYTVTLFDLIGAFKEILLKTPKVDQHRVVRNPVTTEEQADFLISALERNKGQMLFYETMERLTDRISMIVTFLALLDLINRKIVEVTQSSTFGEIWIRKR